MAEEVDEVKTTEEIKETTFMDDLDKATDEHLEDIAERDAEEKEDVSLEKAPPEKEPVVDEPAEKKEEAVKPKKALVKKEQEKGSGEKPPVHDEALLERAVRVGLSLSDANKMPDSEILASVVGRIETANEHSGKKPEEIKVPEGAKEDDLFSDLPDLDPEEYPEEIVGVFKGLKDAVRDQQKTIRSLTEGRQQANATAEAERFSSWLDSQVKGLGKDFSDVLGEGNFQSLESGPKRARQKIARYMDVVHKDAELDGYPITDDSEIFKLALEKVFPDKVNTIKGRETAKKAKERSDKVLHQPRDTTGRFASEDFNEDDRVGEAVAAVAAMME